MWRFRKLLGRRGKTVTPSVEVTDLTIQVTYNESAAQAVENALIKFNIEQAGPSDYRALNVFARNSSGQLIGGVVGSTYWGWLTIAFFWVRESWRHKGLGKKLLHVAEEEAISRGCHSSQLDSFSFQGCGFYEANGYESYGTLDDFPSGHQRFFFRKRLQRQQ